MKRFLWRFKSNMDTIVHYIGGRLVQIVWSKSFGDGGNCSFCYRYDPDNLIPLSEAEVAEIIELRAKRKLSTGDVGIIEPNPQTAG